MKTQTSRRKDFKALEDRRLSAIRMFKQGLTQSEVARRINASRQAVHVWHKKSQKGGEKAILSRKATGRPGKTDISIIKQQIPKILMRGATAYGFVADIWTTKNISWVVQKEYGVRYHRDHIRKILHRIGLSWQKPEKRAIERNEPRIRYWINNTWPAIKKKP